MTLRKTAGTLLVAAAGAGIILSLLGLLAVWVYRPKVTRSVVENLALVNQGFNSTEAVLSTVDQMVQTTSADVSSLQTTTQALSLGIHDANPMFDSLMQLTGRDLPNAITSTQASLASAQSSAVLIDNTLSAISRLPIFPVPPYNPDVPLHTALQNVSTSLDNLSPSLLKINASLGSGKTDMAAVDTELSRISASTQEIGISLANAQAVLIVYKGTIRQLRSNLEGATGKLPKWILIGCWIVSLVFAWTIISQIGLGLHGLEMMQTLKNVDIQEED
jgi:hypothetical protein